MVSVSGDIKVDKRDGPVVPPLLLARWCVGVGGGWLEELGELCCDLYEWCVDDDLGLAGEEIPPWIFVGVVLLNKIGLEAPEDRVGEWMLKELWLLPVDGLLLLWCLLLQ